MLPPVVPARPRRHRQREERRPPAAPAAQLEFQAAQAETPAKPAGTPINPSRLPSRTINILAEHFCDGLVISNVIEGREEYGDPITTAAAFERANGALLGVDLSAAQ